MTTQGDPRTPLLPDDEAFVERLRGEYSPGPMTPARRTSFDLALADRIARRPRRWSGLPAVVAATAAAGLAWLLVPSASDPAVTAETVAAAQWESELFDPVSFIDVEEANDVEELPADYAAIAGVLLDI